MLKRTVETDLLGLVTLAEEEDALSGVFFGTPEETGRDSSPLLREAERQLLAYLAGKLRTPELPMRLHGTAFQQSCWQALRRIPYGETRTYLWEAQAIGNPKACRAVGMANHNNHLPIWIPCHRVIGANGSLIGYGGGLEIKRKLLVLEGAIQP